jgi:DNA (cytosine-5)-methyltransferase 1
MTLTIGSLFSGIGGIDVAFEKAGAKVLWQAEIDKNCRRVLRERWPDVELYEDVKDITFKGLSPMQPNEASDGVSPTGVKRASFLVQGLRESVFESTKEGERSRRNSRTETSLAAHDTLSVDSDRVRIDGVEARREMRHLPTADESSAHRSQPSDRESTRTPVPTMQSEVGSSRGSSLSNGSVGIPTPAFVDVIVGGFPCQDLSVAGKRTGLKGERSGLFFEVIRIIKEMREASNGEYPKYVVLENVPGLLSSNRGRDFGVVLKELAQCGMDDIGWRVLDAQYFGLAQRRKRVFIVGHSGGGADSAEVLFDAESVYGDSPPSRPSKQIVTSALTGRLGSGGPDDNSAQGHHLLAELASRYWDGGDLSDTLDVSMLVKGQMMPEKRRMPVVFAPIPVQNATRGKSQNGLGVGDEGDPMYTLDIASQHAVLTFSCKNDGSDVGSADGYETWEEDETTNTLNQFDVGDVRTTTAIVEAVMGDISHALTGEGCDASKDGTGRGTPIIAQLLQYLTIRRITPLEALRLQGFPDDHLDVVGKPLSDTTKYRMVGNAVAVPCVRWIANRMVAVHERKSNG